MVDVRYQFLTIQEDSCTAKMSPHVGEPGGGRKLFHQFEDVPLKFELFFGRIPWDSLLGVSSKGMSNGWRFTNRSNFLG